MELGHEEIEFITKLAVKESIKESIAYISKKQLDPVVETVNHSMRTIVRDELNLQNIAQEKKKREDNKRILKNTELLIKNFRKCREMVKGIDLENYQDDGTFLASEELTLETLEKQHMKTYKMVRRIEGALAACDEESKHGTEEERLRFIIMKKRYIDDERLSVQQCIDYFCVSQSKVYSDTAKAMKDMASYIFGYDAVIFN